MNDRNMHLSNHHCTTVQINHIGLLIEGSSGSGKSSLAMGLLEYANRHKTPCSFVCDDQAILNVDSGRLIATAPHSIAGLCEIHGYGVVNYPHITHTQVDLIIRLVDESLIERMARPKTCIVNSVKIPLLLVPCRHEAGALRIILAHLGLLIKA